MLNRNANKTGARQLERQGERGGLGSPEMPAIGQPRSQQALSVRLANDGDREIIEELAQLDSGLCRAGVS